jgi:hypothetical protein
MTLHRWHELECGDGNGCIERDETTGKAYWLNSYTMRRTPIADRETGARKRLDRIVNDRNRRKAEERAACPNCGQWQHGTGDCLNECVKRGLAPSRKALGYFIQTDPRGAALYIIRPGDVPPEGKSVESYYSRGICVY